MFRKSLQDSEYKKKLYHSKVLKLLINSYIDSGPPGTYFVWSSRSTVTNLICKLYYCGHRSEDMSCISKTGNVTDDNKVRISKRIR